MTREIKFRAWSIGNQCWVYFGINDCPNWVEPAEVEQYTGLLDKNGVEIYEGDVCKNTSGEIGVIEYGNGMFVSRFVPPYDWDVMAPCDARLDRQEVIGNVYENPELIKRVTA